MDDAIQKLRILPEHRVKAANIRRMADEYNAERALVVLGGCTGVGKSEIAELIARDWISSNSIATVGIIHVDNFYKLAPVDNWAKRIELFSASEHKRELWDYLGSRDEIDIDGLRREISLAQPYLSHLIAEGAWALQCTEHSSLKFFLHGTPDDTLSFRKLRARKEDDFDSTKEAIVKIEFTKMWYCLHPLWQQVPWQVRVGPEARLEDR